MADVNRFDPYHEWLGISPKEYPISLYRLLGLAPFEENEAVIDNAADRQLAFLRQVRAGPRGQAADDLMRQVCEAREILIDPQHRDIYNRGLRAAWDDQSVTIEDSDASAGAPPQALPIAAPPPNDPVPLFNVRPRTAARPLHSRSRRRSTPRGRTKSKSPAWELAKVILGGLAGFVVGAAILQYLVGIDMFGVFGLSDPLRMKPEPPKPKAAERAPAKAK